MRDDDYRDGEQVFPSIRNADGISSEDETSEAPADAEGLRDAYRKQLYEQTRLKSQAWAEIERLREVLIKIATRTYETHHDGAPGPVVQFAGEIHCIAREALEPSGRVEPRQGAVDALRDAIRLIEHLRTYVEDKAERERYQREVAELYALAYKFGGAHA